MAVCWGFGGTSPNENVSKLEADRQTNSQRLYKRQTDRQNKKKEKKSEGVIFKKKQRNPCFRSSDFPANRK